MQAKPAQYTAIPDPRCVAETYAAFAYILLYLHHKLLDGKPARMPLCLSLAYQLFMLLNVCIVSEHQLGIIFKTSCMCMTSRNF